MIRASTSGLLVEEAEMKSWSDYYLEKKIISRNQIPDPLVHSLKQQQNKQENQSIKAICSSEST
jgi:hypothetical protein